ncbi:MAG TPA: MerR family transcriptional regulator [Candidatus Acidoferrales bacterium]|nr:MerR family transcriptional regulator [Candidatus Acidoferrales bacterium]
MLAHAQQDAPEPEKLYRIGDVSRLTDTKPFVLRFWETEFPMLQPVKTPKGHRLYRQEDVDLIRAIKRLLYEEGFTIPGARRHLTDVLAKGEGLASPLERSAESTRVNSPPLERRPVLLADGESEAGRRAAGAAASEPADLRQTLLAVGHELRAILTLLGTR